MRATVWAAAACLLLALLSPISVRADEDAKKIARLQALARAGGGLIELNSKTFKELLVGKSRPYSVFIVADAKNLRSSGQLKLGQLLADYRLVAKTCAATHAGKPSAGHAFFARMEFSRAKDLFGRLGVQALPWLARVPPGLAVGEGEAIKLDKSEIMPAGAAYPWSAEAMAAWVTERSGVAVGEIKRTPLISTRLMPLVSLAVLGCLAFVGYRLYYSPLMRHQWLYVLGALAVYWFSVSGGMFNIIRGVPLVGYDHRKRQSMLFMPGQGQLGAEGFIMGSLYTTVGLTVAALVTVVPQISNARTQRLTAYGLLFLGFTAFRMVTSNHNWKTGLRSNWYF